jgi:hypothetical protein
MITNSKKLAESEKELLRKTKPNYRKNPAIVEALYKEYLRPHGPDRANPLEGIETKIKIARVINSV